MSKSAELVLRIGLAFAFIYPPINAFFDPNSWIGYFPSFMRGIVPDTLLLQAWGVVEIAIALWLLSGWRVKYPAAIASLLLVSIVVFNASQFQIVFRDLAIASIGLCLAISGFSNRQSNI